MSELCEWNPELGCAAFDRKIDGKIVHYGCQNQATLSVGRDGIWHLCGECVSLPAFKRFKVIEKLYPKLI